MANTPWRVQVWVLGSSWDAFVGRMGSQTGWTWVLDVKKTSSGLCYLIYSLVRISISLPPRDCELKGELSLVSSCLGEGTHHPAQISVNRQRKLWGKGEGRPAVSKTNQGPIPPPGLCVLNNWESSSNSQYKSSLLFHGHTGSSQCFFLCPTFDRHLY